MMFYWILPFLFFQAFSKCMSYWKGDTYFTDQVRANSYCPSIITWPISELTASQYQINDAIAKSLYQTLYNTYTNKTDPSLDLGCMGIAMFSFCAFSYPTCNQQHEQIGKTCDWVCNLWNIRCGNQTELYKSICESTDPNVCSYSYFEMSFGIIILITLSLIL